MIFVVSICSILCCLTDENFFRYLLERNFSSDGWLFEKGSISHVSGDPNSGEYHSREDESISKREFNGHCSAVVTGKKAETDLHGSPVQEQTDKYELCEPKQRHMIFHADPGIKRNQVWFVHKFHNRTECHKESYKDRRCPFEVILCFTCHS